MDDFEEKRRFEEAIKAGQSNLRALNLLNNWCTHAEFIRTGGVGLIEAQTGLPIGHMGVQCKHVKQSSICCWLLEDSIYSFYKDHCKDCNKRIPAGFPNIMEFVAPRERAAEERKSVRREEEKHRKQKLLIRQQERERLRQCLSLEETFVLDLLDELDHEQIMNDDPRLEQLANLAPEAFTRKVIEHILPAVLHEKLPYSISAAKALLRTPLKSDEKLSVAVYLVNNCTDTPSAIEVILSEAENLTQTDFIKILFRFVSMAIASPPGIGFGQKKFNKTPIQSLFNKKRECVFTEVDILIKDSNPGKIQFATEIILAVDNDELLLRHIKSIFAKLMRRRTLLPEEGRNSSVVYYLREAATRCLDRYPEVTDKLIQAYLADRDSIGRKEANRTYISVLRNNFRKKAQVGKPQEIAFRRLLWTAVENPEDGMDDAGQFFRHSRDEFSELAVVNFDDLIGAAATLSEKYEQIDKDNLLQVEENFLDHLDKRNKLSAIDVLQQSLIEWASIGAKYKGKEGIKDYLSLYRKIPEEQTQMRGNMIAHVSKLLTGVESLKMTLSDWYRALMDESTLVRAHAIKAWENVPYDLVSNFLDLFFEAYAVLLMDKYVIVHKYAVYSLRRRSFPKEKRHLIKAHLWNLIYYYSESDKQDDFVVDCIDVFASLCLSEQEMKGNIGLLLSRILLSFNGDTLYHAIDRLHYRFDGVPGFVKVALKAIQDDYTRSISIDDCISVILRASHNELESCKEDILKAFNALKPFRPQEFIEALVYVTAFSKFGDNMTANACFQELLEGIPTDNKNMHWRLEAALVAEAAGIEHSIEAGKPYIELIQKWNNLLVDLEKENAEQAQYRNLPPSFFSED